MGLIHHYRLDGDSRDAIGDLHGNASITSWREGKIGDCAELDGVDDIIALGHGIDIFPLYCFSVALWFKSFGQTPDTGTEPGILGLTYGIRLKVNPGYLWFGLDDGETYSRLNSPDDYDFYNDDSWHHVVVSATPTKMFMFIDGEFVAYRNTTWAGTTRWPNNGLRIGRDNNNTMYFFRGLLDDIRIYDHALSQREVRDLSLGLVAHYPMNGDVLDVSGGLPELSFANSSWSYAPAVFGDGLDLMESQTYLTDNGGVLKTKHTVSMWFNRRSNPSYECEFAINGVMYFRIRNNRIQVRIWTVENGDSHNMYLTDGIVPHNEWHHMSVTYDGTSFKAYLNGELAGSVDYPGTLNTNSEPLLIGGRNSVGEYLYDGMICDVRIYATAFTAAQVKELYQQRASIDSEGSVHTSALEEPAFNAVPPLSQWDLPSGAEILGENDIRLNGGTAYSPLFRVDELPGGYFTGEYYSDTANPDDADPDAAGINIAALYFAEDKTTRVENSGGHTANGRAIDFPVSTWEYYSWGHTMGPDIVWCQLRINSDNTHVKPPLRARNVLWTPFPVDEGEYVPYSSGGYASGDRPALGPSSEGLSSAAVSEVGAARGLVAWYPLIGDTLDYAGTNHAENNGAVAEAEGYKIEGTGKVSIPASEVFSTDEFTYTFLFQHNAAVTGDYRVFLLRDKRQPGLWLRPSDNRIHYSVAFDDGNNYSINSPTEVDPETMVHVAVSLRWDGSSTRMRIYLGGTQSVEATIQHRPDPSSSGVTLLKDTCKFADLRIYSRELTPEEIVLEAQRALNPSRMGMTRDGLYVHGQLKEVAV